MSGWGDVLTAGEKLERQSRLLDAMREYVEAKKMSTRAHDRLQAAKKAMAEAAEDCGVENFEVGGW